MCYQYSRRILPFCKIGPCNVVDVTVYTLEWSLLSWKLPDGSLLATNRSHSLGNITQLVLIGKLKGAQEKIDEQKRLIPTMYLLSSKDEGFLTLQYGPAMSINDLIHHVIDLIVHVRRTRSSFVPSGIVIVDYWSLNCEFGVLDVQTSSRKLSNLEHTPYQRIVVLSRVTVGFCKSKRQNFIRSCF